MHLGVSTNNHKTGKKIKVMVATFLTKRRHDHHKNSHDEMLLTVSTTSTELSHT